MTNESEPKLRRKKERSRAESRTRTLTLPGSLLTEGRVERPSQLSNNAI